MVLANNGNCFRCGDEGHWADHCGWLVKAATRTEHEKRLARILQRWHDWEITGMTTREKKWLITEENKLWHGKQKTGARN
jgi:hypothetical protein